MLSMPQLGGWASVPLTSPSSRCSGWEGSVSGGGTAAMPATLERGHTQRISPSSVLGPLLWGGRRCRAELGVRRVSMLALNGGRRLSGTPSRLRPCSEFGTWLPEKGGQSRSRCPSSKLGPRLQPSNMLSEVHGSLAVGSSCSVIPCLQGVQWERCAAAHVPCFECPNKSPPLPLLVAVVFSIGGYPVSGTQPTGRPEALGLHRSPPSSLLAVTERPLRTVPRTHLDHGVPP